ncbi:MAG: protein translocase subunit SecF [Parasynechococcus sp.]|jgi:preprotein translocase subunit SecF|uniref:protein translocase subunit SecF n=1 Tax=Parasynechococcus sp. TaxID=3101203 RepID=UPI002317B4D6|nr:protein translocase subunit SecF [Synechococcus sp. AH-601-J22]MDB4623199.1 protein translocase subunit SecF [bacterium]|tara:strand:+ start:169 stop:1155 length:987 start_codon:yes stop_codon:yes gene_type:complete
MVDASSPATAAVRQLRWSLSSMRQRVWLISAAVVVVSLIGLVSSWLDPTIRAPLRPGLDFTGGTQIQLERQCDPACADLKAIAVSNVIRELALPKEGNAPLPQLNAPRVQLLDAGQSLLLRLPTLSAAQGQAVIQAVEPVAGPFKDGGQSVDTIGPSLGRQLLQSSLVSLLVAFAGIAVYISFRYDRRYAFLALVALAHDVVIVCGIFAWLGLFFQLEVDSLFAVALLTIAGYSVNDTVVVFDRIRERTQQGSDLPLKLQVDQAVSATLTRTLYTSGTTLMPLLALVFFGGSTLYWFAIALALGVVVGSWSSIALAPSLLTLWEPQGD